MTLSTINEVMYLILLVLAVGSIILLWIISHDRTTSFSFTDLISIDGKLNERKITRLGAWVVSTWGFVYLIIADKFTEWYFFGYMGAWVANALIGKALRDRDNEESDRDHARHTRIRSYQSRARPVPQDEDTEL